MVNKIMILTPGSTLVISSPVYAQTCSPEVRNAEQNPKASSLESDGKTSADCIMEQLDECSNETLLSLSRLISAEIEKRGLTETAQSAPESPRPARRRRKQQAGHEA